MLSLSLPGPKAISTQGPLPGPGGRGMGLEAGGGALVQGALGGPALLWPQVEGIFRTPGWKQVSIHLASPG